MRGLLAAVVIQRVVFDQVEADDSFRRSELAHLREQLVGRHTGWLAGSRARRIGHVEDIYIEGNIDEIETNLFEVYATAGIDLNDESIDLRFRIGEHDGVTAAEIFSPLVQIKGTLSEPAVELEPGNTAALIITEGWSLPFNAFEQLSKADENICKASLRRAGLGS